MSNTTQLVPIACNSGCQKCNIANIAIVNHVPVMSRLEEEVHERSWVWYIL